MQHDARAEEGVLYQLKTRGPQTAAQAARRLGVTAMAVRQHLYRLKLAGLVEFSDERRKVGRPARVWRLTAAAADRPELRSQNARRRWPRFGASRATWPNAPGCPTVRSCWRKITVRSARRP